jgi:hypothetical protein
MSDGGTMLDNSCVVSTSSQTYDSSSSFAAKRKTDTAVTSFEQSSSSAQQVTAVGLRLLRESIQAKGLQGQTAEIIFASWRDSTKKQYASYLARWKSFCDRRKIDPLRATVENLLEFLSGLFSQGLGYSALNTACSAVAAVVLCDNEVSIGSNPRVVRFLEGVF